MSAHQLLDAAGRPRSPATMPGHHAGRVPPNKGLRYPADPPTVYALRGAAEVGQSDQQQREAVGPVVATGLAGEQEHRAFRAANGLDVLQLEGRSLCGSVGKRPVARSGAVRQIDRHFDRELTRGAGGGREYPAIRQLASDAATAAGGSEQRDVATRQKRVGEQVVGQAAQRKRDSLVGPRAYVVVHLGECPLGVSILCAFARHWLLL